MDWQDKRLPDEIVGHISSWILRKELLQKWKNILPSWSRLNFVETDFIRETQKEHYAQVILRF
jgi:hypothetical protein